MQLTEESLQSDDGHVKFYAGLPSYKILMIVFKHVSSHMECK